MSSYNTSIETYRFRTVQHPNVEIPEKQSAVVANTAKSICSLVTSPRVKGNRRNPRVVSLTSSNDLPLGERPYRYQVVLATSDNVFAVWRPADADHPPVVAGENVCYSVGYVST